VIIHHYNYGIQFERLHNVKKTIEMSFIKKTYFLENKTRRQTSGVVVIRTNGFTKSPKYDVILENGIRDNSGGSLVFSSSKGN